MKDKVVSRGTIEISRIEADPGIPHAVWINLSPAGKGDDTHVPT